MLDFFIGKTTFRYPMLDEKPNYDSLFLMISQLIYFLFDNFKVIN
ncbi:hypothetical protein MTBBW1_180013 [Desulfamplus magnetovallimortis]|uniref:Uncharacterized protein n=1 Tax=Desulfamplus magnetovallimortis TaxID=1246637 RepID=A0A1W1HAE1_9BACT|nr:hypothetical protein MTBBW1_180013 [Desulfamplus magnetovallimortis]